VTRALLADEKLPLPVINGLIAAGYDVLAAALRALVEVSDGVIAVVTRDDIRLRSLAAIRSID